MLVMTNVMPKIMLAQSIIKAYWLILTWATATVTGWNGTLYSQSSIQTRQTAGGGTAFPASALKRGKIFLAGAVEPKLLPCSLDTFRMRR